MRELAVSKSESNSVSISVDSALQRLIEGNKRFVADHAEHPHQDAVWRAKVATRPTPFALIVTCADARVPPEVIFDQGLGDLFVVRTAAGVLADVVIGTIEFGVSQFGIPLVVVLGHGQCGAVRAAVDAVTRGGHAQGQIASVVEAIRPAITTAQTMPGADLVDNTVRTNTLMICDLLQQANPILAEAYQTRQINILAAHYNMDSGVVELL